jgi:transcriptional regulator with XRE-family HTH domain
MSLPNVMSMQPIRGILPMKKPSNFVDAYVGARLRMRRVMLGMSQSRLGALLGVTFQQVQKYEKGSNRISASRLKLAAEMLETSVDFFLEGAPAQPVAGGGFAEARPQPFDMSFLATTEGFQLNRAFIRIRDAKVRRRIVDLVVSLAPPDDESAPPAP